METKVRRYIDKNEFEKIKDKIDQLPEFTKKEELRCTRNGLFKGRKNH